MFSVGILPGSRGVFPDPCPAVTPATSLRAVAVGGGRQSPAQGHGWALQQPPPPPPAAGVNLSEGEPRLSAPGFHLTGSQPGAPRAGGSAPRHLPWLFFLSLLFFLKRARLLLGSSTAHNPPGCQPAPPPFAGPSCRARNRTPPCVTRRGAGRAAGSPLPLWRAAPTETGGHPPLNAAEIRRSTC